MQELYLDRAYGCEKGRGPEVNLLAVGLLSELTHIIQAEPSRIDDNVALAAVHVIGPASCNFYCYLDE
jgi:hypothetical protein